MSHLVFVYGTLKRGQPNYHVITNEDNGSATLHCMAETVEKWPLVIATRFNVPFLLNKPGHGHHINGEIYKVDDKMLNYMDEFEDVPLWYQRHKLDCRIVKDLDTGTKKDVNNAATNAEMPNASEEAVKCQSEDQDIVRDRKKDIDDSAATSSEMANALEEAVKCQSEDKDIVRDRKKDIDGNAATSAEMPNSSGEAEECKSEDQDIVRDRKKDVDSAVTNTDISNECALQETEEPKSEDQDIVRDVWFYVLDNFKESMTKWKYLDNYDSNGDQGLPYDEGLDDEDWEMDYSVITETINVDIPVENWVEGMPEGWKGVEGN